MDTNITIDCMYSCNPCNLKKIHVKVPVRTDETVKDWMINVAVPLIKKDHDTRSPQCTAEKMDELWIPISGAEKIGGPSLQ